MRMAMAGLVLVTLISGTTTMASDTVQLYAAGSLKAAMGDVADAFEKQEGVTVATTFGPSGLLRQRIENGEAAAVFASANMAHPHKLAAAGKGGPVVMFARNRLCAIAQADSALSQDNFLETLLDPSVVVGTSTPNADPSGDYAWKLFERADRIRAGSFATLDAKANKLTGGPDSSAPPEGRFKYAWVMTEFRPDVFLTYCTNAVLAQKEVPELRIVQVPEALSVGADYGLTVLLPDQADAGRLAMFILSPAGQEILARYGFVAPGLP